MPEPVFQDVAVRRKLFLSVVAACLCSCGGGSDAPRTVDGKWTATAQPAGTAITFDLKEQDSKVVGAGTYLSAGGVSGVLVVAGAHSGSAVTLEFAYDTGARATYAGLLIDPARMSGVLTVQGGGTTSLVFARQ